MGFFRCRWGTFGLFRLGLVLVIDVINDSAKRDNSNDAVNLVTHSGHFILNLLYLLLHHFFHWRRRRLSLLLFLQLLQFFSLSTVVFGESFARFNFLRVFRRYLNRCSLHYTLSLFHLRCSDNSLLSQRSRVQGNIQIDSRDHR